MESIINELFDPFQSGRIRDKSIDSLHMYPYYPVGGKDVSNYQNNTLRIVTKGIDQHLLLCDGYLEGVCQIPVPTSAARYEIVLGVNDTFTQNGPAVKTIPPGTYTATELAAAMNALATAPGDFTFSVVTVSGVDYWNLAVAAAKTVQLTNAPLAALLGYTDAAVRPVGVAGDNGNSPYVAPTPLVIAWLDVVGNEVSPVMHSNVLAIFRKASLYFNNVMVHQIDWPHMSDTITNLRDQSQDYNDKRKDEWFYLDATQNYNAADASTAAKLARTHGNLWFRWQVPLKRLFPFLNAYEKVLRGIEIRIELEKNNGNMSEIIMMDENAVTDGIKLQYKELTMWVPIVVGAPSTEAMVISEITSKNETLVRYTEWGNYRRQNPISSEITWLIDNISEVPKTVYVMCQLASQLDNISIAGNANVNPATFQHLNLVRAELRINGHVFPKMPYQILFDESTATQCDDYTRLFFEWLRVNYKEAEFDNGSLITYDTFKSIYPIITFNLTREEEVQMRTGENNVIEVFLQFSEPTAQAFYSWALVEYDAKLLLKSNGKQVDFVRL